MARRLLTFVCFAFFMGCGGSEAPMQTERASPDVSHRQRLAKLKYRRDKLLLAISRLEKDRAEVIARIRGHGIESTDDLKSHPEWTIHARELKEVIGSIRQLQSKVSSFDAAIVRIESILRRADREMRTEYSTLTDEELDDLAQAFDEADEQLKSQTDVPGGEDIELESLLEQELNTN